MLEIPIFKQGPKGYSHMHHGTKLKLNGAYINFENRPLALKYP